MAKTVPRTVHLYLGGLIKTLQKCNNNKCSSDFQLCKTYRITSLSLGCTTFNLSWYFNTLACRRVFKILFFISSCICDVRRTLSVDWFKGGKSKKDIAPMINIEGITWLRQHVMFWLLHREKKSKSETFQTDFILGIRTLHFRLKSRPQLVTVITFFGACKNEWMTFTNGRTTSRVSRMH